MPQNLSFVHLTDLHIGNPDVADTTLKSDTTTTLRAILAQIASLHPAPAFIAVSGDLTNRGDARSYEAVRTIFAESGLDMPIVFALGNHDRRPAFYATMLGDPDRGTAPYDHDLVIDGLHILVLDTTVPGRIGGGLESGQFDWLADRLASRPELPRLIVMHHGPMLDPQNAAAEWESLPAADTARLHDLLVSHDNIVGILCGHIHYDRVSNWYGIPVIVGIGQHAATDVLYLDRGLRMLAGASFAVCTLRSSGLTVSFSPQPSDRRELAVLTTDGFNAYRET